MAGQYLNKNVTYTEKDGKRFFTITLNKVDWMKNIQVSVDGQSVSYNKKQSGENADLTFEVNSENSQVMLHMNVVPMGNATVGFRIVNSNSVTPETKPEEKPEVKPDNKKDLENGVYKVENSIVAPDAKESEEIQKYLKIDTEVKVQDKKIFIVLKLSNEKYAKNLVVFVDGKPVKISTLNNNKGKYLASALPVATNNNSSKISTIKFEVPSLDSDIQVKTYIDEMNKDVNFGVKLKEDTLKLSDTKPEQKPETKPDTEKPENKSDTKPDEGKSETKAEQKPETKPISKEEKDGLYSLKAKILKENSDDPSMSAQYVKDINYEVKDAKIYLIVTLNRTDWMKNITATVDGKEITPTVIEKIKNNNGEEISRIKFPINSLDSKIKLTMNVVPMDNSRVSFRIVPDKNSLKSIKEYNNIASEKDESNSENFKKEDKLVKINSLADGGKEEGKATGKVLPKTGSPINSGLLGSLGVIISGLGLGLKKKGKK